MIANARTNYSSPRLVPHICAVFADVGYESLDWYSRRMPHGLVRYHESGQTHFITFSCYDRQPHMASPQACAIFLSSLERFRRKYLFRVYGYVLMPEHVHLLLSEPETGTVATSIQALKISVARHVSSLQGPRQPAFWQKRYYDHNVRSHESFVNKLQYIHRNPVKRGLCASPEEWPWSSFHHYATAEPGAVEIESQWTADRRTGKIPRLLAVARGAQ